MTPAFGGRYSIQLSYGRIAALFSPICAADLNEIWGFLSRRSRIYGSHGKDSLQQLVDRLLAQQPAEHDGDHAEHRGQSVVRPGEALC